MNTKPNKKTCYSRAVVGTNLTTGERRKWPSVKTLRLVRRDLEGNPDVDAIMKGVELGFDTAVNYVNKIYLEA